MALTQHQVPTCYAKLLERYFIPLISATLCSTQDSYLLNLGISWLCLSA